MDKDSVFGFCNLVQSYHDLNHFVCLQNNVFRKKHPFTFSFISPWRISIFTQNFQGMFMKN